MSTSNDWRTPFKELSVGLRSLYDANLNLFHGVLLSTRRTKEELKPTFGILEPAYSGESLLSSIEVDTVGATFHGHLFFARDRKVLDQLGRLLDGIESWMDAVPSGVLPGFEIPKVRSQVDRNLIRWASIVYYLAWSSDRPYLDLEIEFEEQLGVFPFLPWIECPQPPSCRPLEWLTHRSSASAALLKIKTQFEQRKELFPDVVHAYLTGEFIASSMAAIDILVYVLHGERKNKSKEQLDYVEKLKRTKRGKSKFDKDVDLLTSFLLVYHNPRDNTDMDLNPEEALTADQIGDKMGWTGPPRSVASRVSRAMERIFGHYPMKEYKRSLLFGIKSKLPDGASLLFLRLVDPCWKCPSEDN